MEIQRQRGAAKFLGERPHLPEASSGDHDLMPVPDQKFGKPGTEDAIAAKDNDLHSISLARSTGSGISHILVLPKSRYRLRASRR